MQHFNMHRKSDKSQLQPAHDIDYTSRYTVLHINSNMNNNMTSNNQHNTTRPHKTPAHNHTHIRNKT